MSERGFRITASGELSDKARTMRRVRSMSKAVLARKIQGRRKKESQRRSSFAAPASPIRCTTKKGIRIERIRHYGRANHSFRTTEGDGASKAPANLSHRAAEGGRYRRLLETVTSYIYTVFVEDGHSVLTRHGKGCEGVTGFTPSDYDRDPGLWYRMIHPEDQAKVIEMIRAVFLGADTRSLVHRIRHKDGSYRWIRNVLVPHRENGALAYYDGIVNDITERKNAEIAISESEENLRLVMENSHDMIFSADRSGRLVTANTAFLSFLLETGNRIAIGDFVPGDFISDRDNPDWLTLLRQCLEGRRIEAAFEVQTRDGRKRLEMVANPISSMDGAIVGIGVFLHDVTEKDRAERAIRAVAQCAATGTGLSAMEGIARSIEEQLDAEAVLVGRIDDAGDVLPLAVRISGERREAIGPLRGALPCCKVAATDCCSLPRRDPSLLAEASEPIFLADGHLVAPIRNREGRPIGLICAMFKRPFHVTNVAREMLSVLASKAAAELHHCRMEDELRRSIAEQEILLKEVNHRVKNNLQIITSLISLQEDSSDCAETDGFRELNGRIHSIALVHDCLYGPNKYERVDVVDYFGRLCSHLAASFFPVGSRVRLETDLRPAMIPPDQAVLCGLIVNELVLNAFKHAFPEGRGGIIKMEAGPEGNRLRLSVRDDGIGDSPPGGKSSSSLGLSLVGNLSAQLGGILEFECAKGFAYTVRFPIPETRDPLGPEEPEVDAVKPGFVASPIQGPSSSAGIIYALGGMPCP